MQGGQFETVCEAASGKENPAQQGEGQSTASQHEILRSTD